MGAMMWIGVNIIRVWMRQRERDEQSKRKQLLLKSSSKESMTPTIYQNLWTPVMGKGERKKIWSGKQQLQKWLKLSSKARQLESTTLTTHQNLWIPVMIKGERKKFGLMICAGIYLIYCIKYI